MTEKIAVVDCGAGNLRSLIKAFEFINETGASIELTRDPNTIKNADRLVLPGQGAYGDCLQSISEPVEVLEAIEHAALKRGVPFLGICVGMQLLGNEGFERGRYGGLGFVRGRVTKMPSAGVSLPHIGWSALENLNSHPLLKDQFAGDFFYFAHSYQLVCDEKYCVAQSLWGKKFNAIVAKDNILGLQFHPEKSSSSGLALLKLFMRWRV